MSELIRIENEYIKAAVHPLGAELHSVRNQRDGYEYLWQGGSEWPRRAPHLFPVVGSLRDGLYSLDGREYQLGRHGFARDCVFSKLTQNTSTAVLRLNSTDIPGINTFYPFPFVLDIGYTLQRNTLTVRYNVRNRGSGPMYFSIGAHPGFNVSSLSNCKIVFDHLSNADRYLLTQNGLLEQGPEQLELNKGELPLSLQLFERDAVVLKNAQIARVMLADNARRKVVTLEMHKFGYFGLWSPAGCDKFVCLEPWNGVSDTVNFEGELPQKEGIVTLAPDKSYTVDFTLGFE